ncbi:MAG: carboxypeptidase-like regulatory domain-containing protein [Paraclostridium sp.]
MTYSVLDIPSSLVYDNTKICVKLIIDNPSKLIQGTVLDDNDTPVKNAGIEVVEIDIQQNKKTLGSTFTNEFGEYSFFLKINPQYDYEFKLYPSI